MAKKDSPPIEKLSKKKITLFERQEKEKLETELEMQREKAKDYLTRLMYLQADFENYRKRVKKDLEEMAQYGSRRLITELLPIIDELEYALEAGMNNSENKAFIKGLEIILKKLYEVLKREGLSNIDAVGKSFDPKKHEVIEKVPTHKYKEGIVVEESRKGYMLKDRVIRPSLVKVTTIPEKKGVKVMIDE